MLSQKPNNQYLRQEQATEQVLNYPGVTSPTYQEQVIHVPSDPFNHIFSQFEQYEYSKPVTYTGKSATAQKISTPFNTECEFCIINAALLDATGQLQVTIDNNTPGVLTSTPTDGFLGYYLSGTAPFNPFDYWSVVKEYLFLQTASITNGYNITFGFRRKQQQIIPRNPNSFNYPGN